MGYGGRPGITISIRISKPCVLLMLCVCRSCAQWVHVSVSIKLRLSANQQALYVYAKHKDKYNNIEGFCLSLCRSRPR